MVINANYSNSTSEAIHAMLFKVVVGKVVVINVNEHQINKTFYQQKHLQCSIANAQIFK